MAFTRAGKLDFPVRKRKTERKLRKRNTRRHFQRNPPRGQPRHRDDRVQQAAVNPAVPREKPPFRTHQPPGLKFRRPQFKRSTADELTRLPRPGKITRHIHRSETPLEDTAPPGEGLPEDNPLIKPAFRAQFLKRREQRRQQRRGQPLFVRRNRGINRGAILPDHPPKVYPHHRPLRRRSPRAVFRKPERNVRLVPHAVRRGPHPEPAVQQFERLTAPHPHRPGHRHPQLRRPVHVAAGEDSLVKLP